MKKTLKFCLLIFSFTLISCQDELKIERLNNTVKEPAEKTIKNGRFVFSSRESLRETIKEIQNKGEENVEREFERLYQNGFRSHIPIVNSENQELQSKLSQEIFERKKLKNSQSNLLSRGVDLEPESEVNEFIADPVLAAIVNQNNEIIVNDTLYKFTQKDGLYFSHVSDSTKLIDYVENEVNRIRESRPILEPCEFRYIYGGITNVNGEISRYVAPIKNINDCRNDASFPMDVGNPPNNSLTTEEEKLQERINNLSLCQGRNNWLQNIFGKSYYCIDRFDRKRRIKIEFWDQSWLFYKSVGIMAKTQRRRFGVWWASKSDELHLGVNRVLLRYNYKQPIITSINFNTPYKFPLYMYKGTIQTKQDPNGTYYVNTQVNVPEAKIPFFDFGNKDILNVYIPNTPIFGNTNVNLTTQDITSQSNIKALYKLGVDYLKSKFNTGRVPKEFAIVFQKNTNEVEVLYFGERIKETNENKIKKKFYSDVSFVLSSAWGDATSKWKFSVKPAEATFRNYTYYELDFFGMARRGSAWKGNRMIR